MCGILYFKLSAIDAINEIANPRIIERTDIIYIAEHGYKGSGNLLLVFLDKPMYEVCLILIKAR
jgi:hypothetical protein